MGMGIDEARQNEHIRQIQIILCLPAGGNFLGWPGISNETVANSQGAGRKYAASGILGYKNARLNEGLTLAQGRSLSVAKGDGNG